MSSGSRPENLRNSSAALWTLGEWTVRPAANEIVHPVAGRVRLEARAMQVLELLRAHAGEVVTTEQFLERVWHGKVVTPHSVAAVISELRKALGPDTDAADRIETIPKRGYRLRATAPAAEPCAHARSWRTAIAAAAVAIALAVLLGVSRLASQGTRASPAVESGLTAQYLRARQLWSRREHDATLQARAMLEEIVARDSGFAPAHAALADIYAHKTGDDLGVPEMETFREAQRHLDVAMGLDPDLAESHVTRALLDFYRDHQPRKGLATLDTALRKDPRFAYAWQTQAMLLSALGEHASSLAAIERARALDPVSNSIGWDRVWFLYLAGQHERARQAYDEEAGRSQPNYLFGALIEQARGNSAESLRLWLRRLELRGARLPDPGAVETLAARAHFQAAYGELLRQVQTLPAYRESSVVRAVWQQLAGDSQAAAATLASASADRRNWLQLWVAQIPVLAPLRHANATAQAGGNPAP